MAVGLVVDVEFAIAIAIQAPRKGRGFLPLPWLFNYWLNYAAGCVIWNVLIVCTAPEVIDRELMFN
jgi:hypothetical protein